MSNYVIGMDYGTLSGRAVLVDAADGTIVAEAALDYPHGVMDRTLPDGTPLPGSWALQDPRDYLEVLEKTVPQVLKDSGVDPEDVIGLGLDTTSATLIPVGEDGLPLSFHEKWAAVPPAWCKLWKHHAAQAQAERFTTLMGEDLLSHYGGRVSSEWVYPKILEVREEAPEVYEAADRFLDACDWLTAWLTGETKVSACSAGYKAFWRKEEGYPSRERVANVAPYLADVAETKLDAPVLALGQPVGCLTEEACRLTGLTTRCVVAVGNVDAHASVPGSGLSRPGELLVILGTSACSMVCAEQEHFVPGICGSCQWYAAAVCENPGNYQTMLREVYHSTPALQPRMPWIDSKAPGKPRKTAVVWTQDGPFLFWTQPKAKTVMDEAAQYVVYRFNKGEKVNLEDPSHILCITRETSIPLSYQRGSKSYVYVVTALDRIQNESKGVKKKIKL